MIFGIKTLHFIMLMLCALFAGALGSVIALLVRNAAAAKTKSTGDAQAHSHVARRAAAASNWQKAARDEQLYNGR